MTISMLRLDSVDLHPLAFIDSSVLILESTESSLDDDLWRLFFLFGLYGEMTGLLGSTGALGSTFVGALALGSAGLGGI